GRIYLRTGETASAINAFQIALWSQDTVDGRVALAQAYILVKDYAAARTALERALVIDPKSSDARELLGKLTP
ncbi:MAG TPA: tetratricopeptide repeat protein, partial [Vicinamibacterales bacterium]